MSFCISWCCWDGSEARKHPTVQTCLLPVCCQMFETAMRWRCSQASASSCHKRTTLCLMCEWEVFIYKLTYFIPYLFCFNDALDLHHHLHPPLLFLWKGAFYPELWFGLFDINFCDSSAVLMQKWGKRWNEKSNSRQLRMSDYCTMTSLIKKYVHFFLCFDFCVLTTLFWKCLKRNRVGE